MGKTRNDEIYEEGVKEGKDGGIFSDAMHEYGKILPVPSSKEYEIRSKAYEYGRDHRDSDSSSDDSSSSSSSDDSCCYITTACLRSLGMPEDSLEFKAMKILTREHILKSRQGKRDYISYGRKLPMIVKKIEARIDAKEIWENVYERLKDITKLVSDRNYEEGYQSYRGLVTELSEKF